MRNCILEVVSFFCTGRRAQEVWVEFLEISQSLLQWNVVDLAYGIDLSGTCEVQSFESVTTNCSL